MGVYSFSTKPDSEEEALIQRIKAECVKNCINFSAFVIQAIKLQDNKGKHD